MLAGGASRRIGGKPKGLEQVGGTRIIDRVVKAISKVTPVSILAANAQEANNWLHGVAVVSDYFRDSGGLAGVHAALKNGKDIIVVAWDMPFVTPGLLTAILDRAISSGAPAVIPESRAPAGMEPFCAYYGIASLAAIESFLSAGGGAAHALMHGLPGIEWLPLAEVEKHGSADRLFFSVNTPADLAQARAMAGAAQ